METVADFVVGSAAPVPVRPPETRRYLYGVWVNCCVEAIRAAFAGDEPDEVPLAAADGAPLADDCVPLLCRPQPETAKPAAASADSPATVRRRVFTVPPGRKARTPGVYELRSGL